MGYLCLVFIALTSYDGLSVKRVSRSYSSDRRVAADSWAFIEQRSRVDANLSKREQDSFCEGIHGGGMWDSEAELVTKIVWYSESL